MQKSEFRYAFISEIWAPKEAIYASEPFLALRHASGVFAHRTITGYRESYDATKQLREFCRGCAAKMLPHWPQAPALFLEWCATGTAELTSDIWAATTNTDPGMPRLIVQSALWAQEEDDFRELRDYILQGAEWTAQVLHDVEPVRDEFNRLISNGFE